MPRRWYVAETETRGEGVAVANLERQSFTSFCPRFRKVRRHARRVDTVLAPLFPGYVFVRFDVDTDPWRSINGTRGVRRLVSISPARPRPMPEAAMTQLLASFGEDPAPEASVRIGDSVKIVSGPFAEQLATVESLDGKGRVRVLLEILGSSTGLRLSADSIVPADE
ncbi:transcription termination/antitermination protein NusG [Sphingomonas soli]|uniref:transcription termination/antitermination protein NusG n=1 Tax=Sphingomonas soli TaxID=266127 RepID=UPI00082EB502|nr:transcriptional activator RfaH [Sphingomonas soli]